MEAEGLGRGGVVTPAFRNVQVASVLDGRDDGGADGGQVGGPVAGTAGGIVFAERRIPDVVVYLDVFIVTGTDISTVLSALHMAAYDKRNSAEMCADCGDLSCQTCQYRLQAARAYDHLTARILETADAQAPHRDQPEPGSSRLSPGQADPAAGIEAGQ